MRCCVFCGRAVEPSCPSITSVGHLPGRCENSDLRACTIGMHPFRLTFDRQRGEADWCARRRRSAQRADSPACPGACRRRGVRQARNSPQGLFRVRAHCVTLLARRPTRCAPFGRSAQTGAASQSTKRASRAARRAALLGASHARPGRPAADFADPTVVFDRRKQTRWLAEGGGCPCPEVKEEPAAEGRWRGTWRARAPAVLGTLGHGTQTKDGPRRVAATGRQRPPRHAQNRSQRPQRRISAS